MCDKRFSMYRTWSIFLQCFNMRCRTISFIGGKSVFRKNLIIFFHHPVSGHFGNNTCCRKDTLFASPLMMGTCGIWISGLVTASFKSSCGCTESLLTAWLHCLISCLQDIDLINPLRTCHSNSNRNCSLQDHIVQFFSLLSCKLFRIIQP